MFIQKRGERTSPLRETIMKPYTSLKSILAEFFPLHRTLVSDDHDKTLEIVGSYMPDSSNYTIETYAPLTKVWTWQVPERYVVHEAYLEDRRRRARGGLCE